MLRHGVVSGGNPFQPQGNPYCVNCKMEVDSDVNAVHTSDGMLMYREICRRCKQVITFGVQSNVGLVGRVDEWLVGSV